MSNCKDGDRGPRGFAGKQGQVGQRGLKGDRGIQGPQGIQGFQGKRGEIGPTGRAGDQGPMGLTGRAGANGIDGTPGKPGEKGLRGVDGKEGRVGETGPIGRTGAVGPPGPDGKLPEFFTFGFQAESEPLAIPPVAEAFNDNELCSAGSVIQKISTVYDDSNSYDSSTGIWTVPMTGRYDLSFFVSLTTLRSWKAGELIVGITHPTSCLFYSVNSVEIKPTKLRIQLSGSAIAIELNKGDNISLKIMNVGSNNYNPLNGDIVRFTSRKVG